MSLVLGLGKDLLSYTFHECDMRVSRQLYLHLCSYHTICASVCVRVSLENYYYHNYCQLRQQRKATTTLGAQKVCTIMADKKSALAFNSTEFNSQHKHGPTAMHCPKKKTHLRFASSASSTCRKSFFYDSVLGVSMASSPKHQTNHFINLTLHYLY